MARGSSEHSNLKLFYMSIRGLKKGQKIYIEQVEPLGNKQYNKDLPPVYDVSGVVTKVEHRVRTLEFGDKDEIVIYLKDIVAGEMYILSCGMNGIGRSMINSLASIEGNLGKLEISVYMNKAKDMPAITIRHNGEKISWKFSIDEQRKYIKQKKEKTKVNGKTIDKIVNDYDDLNEFFLNLLKNEIAAKVQSIEQPQPKNEAVPDGPEDDSEAGDENDDLPF